MRRLATSRAPARAAALRATAAQPVRSPAALQVQRGRQARCARRRAVLHGAAGAESGGGAGRGRQARPAHRRPQVRVVEGDLKNLTEPKPQPSPNPAAPRSCAAAQALSAAAVPSFQVLRVPGDGSCLFRALAQGRSVLERGALTP